MRPAFYQPSGQIPLLAFPSLLACVCLAAAGALPHAWFSAQAPWYTGIITIWPFAFWLHLIVKTAGSVAKVRSPVMMKEFGLVVGVFGWACQWIFWIVFASYDSVRSMPGHSMAVPLADMLAYPTALWDGFRAAAAATGWGDDMDEDLIRCFSWLVEFSLLLTVPGDAGRKQARKPFCEASHQWASVTRLPYRFAVGPLLQVRADFVAHPEQALAKLSLTRSTNRFVTATVYTGKYEDFMSVEMTELQSTGRGYRRQEEMVVEYLRVPRGALEGLIQRLAKPKRKKAKAARKKPAQAKDGLLKARL